MSSTNYGGFWIRFVALIIDGVALYIVQTILLTILGAVGLGFATGGGFDLAALSNPESIGALVSAIMAASVVGWIIQILYGTIMESSKYQATLGKMALGLKVTDINGNRLDFIKSLLRQIGKIISGMLLLIGYIIAAFTEKKQALHDYIASTVVVKK
ncbi:MAG: RDD family protein [Cyclobacteriaceae bacterium]|nr:RDD family protein [Cyclobacteriaceae bacterium HetDA_MAG_MS6]